MAALRRRRTEDANVAQEPAEEAQATLDFGSAEEPAVQKNEADSAPEASAEPAAQSTENNENTSGEESSETPAQEGDNQEQGKIVVKRRRVVKKTEETEGAATDQNAAQTAPAQAQQNHSANTEERPYNNNNNYNRYQNNQRNNYNNRKGAGMRKPYGRNSYTPPSPEMVESMAAEAAAAAEENANKPRLLINDLTKESMPELRDRAMEFGFTADDLAPMKKQDLIFVILKAHTEHGGIIFAEGSLEILPDGYGFLRSPQNSYLPGPDDIYISPSQIRLFNLKTGDTVYGQTRSPKEGERFFALLL